MIRAQGRRAKPRGIQWAELSGEQLAATPPLVRLAPARAGGIKSSQRVSRVYAEEVGGRT